jgi:hypothetical protein
MKTQIMALAALIFILSACSTTGTKFFINNHEAKPVSLQYKYFEKGRYADSAGFDYAPEKSVMVSKEIVKNKILKKFPFYDSRSYFDTLQVAETALLTYQCYIPSKSTMYIAPIYKYGGSIEYLVLNNKDTIRFTNQSQKVEYPVLMKKKLIVYKNSLVGNPCFLVNLKLKEMEEMLKK